jgi:FkbM family methyltransferase
VKIPKFEFNKRLKSSILFFLSRFNLAITSLNNLQYLNLQLEQKTRYETFVKNIFDSEKSAPALFRMNELYLNSKSQLFQDLFVLDHLEYKKMGYFVEIGAAGGKDLSNTWLMEKKYDWTGILVEPGITWQDELRSNRSSIIVTKAIWSISDHSLEFSQAARPELSGISDVISKHVTVESKYFVKTLSLNDLLDLNAAPKIIEYLSIDVEGGELEILKNFDFNLYKFNFISVEHNYRSDRAEVAKLLERVGYVRYLENISGFDDWYVQKDSISPGCV